MLMLLPPMPMLLSPCSRDPSLGCPVRTTPSTPRFQSQDLLVTVRLTEVTMRTLRLSARRSSSATGGSTSTAPPPRSSTPSTTRLQQRETPLLELVLMLLETMLLLLPSTLPRDQ